MLAGDFFCPDVPGVGGMFMDDKRPGVNAGFVTGPIALPLLRFALPLIGTADPFTLFCEAGIQLGSLLALPLIFRCNGRRRRPGRGVQFLEYLYYPLHLALIDLFLF